MRGRKPRPIQQQINEGDRRQRGPKKLNEQLASIPKAERGLPECPSYLGAIAHEKWMEWKDALEKANLANKPDTAMLEGACVWYERAVIADRLIREKILIIDEVLDKQGKPTGRKRVNRNPAWSASREAWVMVHSFCSEFGLSPVSRQRLRVEANPSNESLFERLNAPRPPKEPPKATLQ